MKLTLSISAVCDIGCMKPNNEDMILIHDEIFRDGKIKADFDLYETRLIFAVADGVGGLNNGEIASGMVLSSLRDILMKIPDDLTNDELKEVFDTFTAETHSGLANDMGSTLVGLFFYNSKLFRFHAGDSRLYRLRRRELERLTVDHSLRESGGQKNAPSNIITNSIGGGSSSFIEFAEIAFPFYANDLYLLSSDGMHDLVSQGEILETLDNPKIRGDAAAKKLVNLAKKYGGKDNISVVTIKIKET